MSSKTLEGMARAACDADGSDGDYDKNPPEIREALATDMKRALLWLADNVSDEMVATALRTTPGSLRAYKGSPALSLMIDAQRHDISAALRAAAEGSE